MADITGTAFDDILNGTIADDLIYGLGGNDTLIGGAGNDDLVGGPGNDILNGGDGVDTADYRGAVSGLTASLASPSDNTGDAYGDTYIGIENLSGSSGNDTLIGDSGPNKIYGGRGSDILEGGAGNDILEGNAGFDEMSGGQGDDIYFIDSAKDFVFEKFNEGIDTVYTSVLAHTLASGVENVTYIPTTRADLTSFRDFTGIGNDLDNLMISINGNDVLNGKEGNDTLDSGVGDDVLIGGTGNDTLIAGYGVDFLIGGDGNDLLIGGGGYDYLIGGAGFDTASYTDSAIGVSLNLKTGVYTGGAAGDTIIEIEAFIGSNLDDTFVGNGTTVTFNGGAGYDYVDYSASSAAVNVSLANNVTTLATGGDAQGNSLVNIEGVFGSAFADMLSAANGTFQNLAGGAGNDVYIDNSHQTNIVEGLDDGDDEIRTAWNSYSMENIFFVERLTFTGTGNAALTGNFGDNVLTGGTGDDWLDGGLGNDTLIGGQGNDVYSVDSLADVITESINAGIDTVRTGLSAYTLGANVENLTYTGTTAFVGTGNALGNSLTSADGNDKLNGDAGNDVLDGGAGNDTLLGGTGNDRLVGGAGNDTLDGGIGNDTLIGGLGNDTYVVDSLGDMVTENVNEGVDYVRTSLSAFALGDNVEHLAYTGTSAFIGTGNTLNNSITSGNGNDVLDGGAGNDSLSSGAGNDTLIGGAGNDTLTGGLGNDTLIGGLGNDTYVVDSLGDIVTETLNEGSDTVKTSLSAYTLGANVENLSYTGTSAFIGTGNALNNSVTSGNGNDVLDGGAGNDSLSSGAGNDILIGGAGNDTLTGGLGDDVLRGGAGNDALTGSAGLDMFVFELGGGRDAVKDFAATDDTFAFDRASFGIAASATIADYVRIGGATVPASPDSAHGYFLVSSTGIFWDGDGSGSGVAVQLASYTSTTAVTIDDFLFV